MMRASSFLQRPPLLLLAAALIALTFLFTPDAPPAQAQATVTPGSLDTTFSSDGKVTTNVSSGNDSGHAVAVQPDGKIVVGGVANGDFAVVRYNADGSLETTFSSNGKVTTSIGSANDTGNALALQPDGKIVVAGFSENGSNKDFAVARYTATGALDTAFGTVVSGQTRSGYATTAIGSADEEAYALALQSDGKIVLAGESNNGTSEEFALVRYDANGTPDTSFGTGGKVTTDFGTGIDRILSLLIQPDGKIVAAGTASADFALARYNTDGSLDNSFSNDGKVTTDFAAANQSAYGIALQPDGRIVAAGSNNSSHLLSRYNADGSLDATFGDDGKVVARYGPRQNDTFAMTLQPDGRILTAGIINVQPVNKFGLVRYNANGSLDTTFGTDGVVTTEFGSTGNPSGAAAAWGIELQSDGKILVSGSAQFLLTGGATRYDFALARYNNPPPPETAPGPVTMVSNHGQTAGASYGTNNRVHAQAFTTGSSANGYVLTAIDAVFESTPSSDEHISIRAELWSASTGGAPDEKIAVLDPPDHITSGATASFAVKKRGQLLEYQNSDTLAANTSYFFLIYTTNDYNLRIDHVTTTGEDDGAADGWSIADDRYHKNNQLPGGSNSWTAASNPLKITVKGYALTDPPPKLTGLAALLNSSTSINLQWALPQGTISSYDVHYTSAPSTGENAVGNDDAAAGGDPAAAWVDANHPDTINTHDVTGLTPNTEYRFRVRARNALGAGQWAFATATPITLVAPPNLAVMPGDRTLHLTWTRPKPGIFGVVHFTSASEDDVGNEDTASGGDPAAAWVEVTDAAITSYTLGGQHGVVLDNGTLYRVRVRARFSNDDVGPWSFIPGTPVEPPPSEVTLSASPNPVPEGSPVTVTATLSQARSSAVDIPLTVTDHTAESDDHGTLTSIAVPAGTTTAEAQITTAQDDDGDDETFTVALGTLPSTLTAGDPSSVKITIRDDDRASLAVNLVTNAGETAAGTDAALTASGTVAQAFRAGGNANGYTLSAVEVQFANNVGQAARDSMKAEIWSNGASDTPGAKLFDLTVPDAISAGVVSFAAPAGAALSADTGYWLLIWANPITNGLKTTASDDETGEAGWSIENTFRSAGDNPPTGSSTWDTPTDGRSLLLTVKGTTTSIWSAALTVQSSGGASGCSNDLAGAECSSTSVLTDDDFTYKDVDYQVSAVQLSGAGLVITMDQAIPTDLSLNVDDKVFPATDGALSNSDRTVTWTNAGLSWSQGDTVLLSLAAYCNCTVSLSAAPDPVDDGSPVTVTATLSSAPAVSETVPLTITAGTAESDDFGAMATITIRAGETTGTGTITTADDDDIDHETLTVALGALPQGITMGSPSSLEVTIKDTDFRLAPSSQTVVEGNSVRVQVLNFPDFTAVESTGTGSRAAKVGAHFVFYDDEPFDFTMEPSTTYTECHGSTSRPHDCVTLQVDHWGRPYDGWITIGTIPDGVDEGDETIELTAFNVLDTTQRTDPITITLRDLDPAKIILTPTSTSLRRGGDTVTVSLSLDRPSPETTAIRITPSGTASILPLGQPHTGHDYDIPQAQLSGDQPEAYIWVDKGKTRGRGELTLTALDDATPGETIILTARSVQAPNRFRQGETTITIGSPVSGQQAGGSSGSQRAQAPPNRPPTVSQALADVAIVNESGTRTVSLSGVFDDADEDALSVRAASSDESVATVSVASGGSSLTVNAQGRGAATIGVTAEDINGETVSDTFTVTVKAAPVVASAIADVGSLEAGSTKDIALSAVFSDADGDVLTITAASSDESKATMSVASDGTKLTLSGVAEGTATITVTARDSDGNRVSDAFDVSVTAPPPLNQAPTVADAFADATIVHESGTWQVSLSGVFDDADNDALTITASSGDEAVATVSVTSDQSSLTVTAKARGTATVTVTASDGNGGKIKDSFTVKVKGAPTVASAIADLSGLETGDTRDVSLSAVFSDADGDSLTITVTSSDEAIATAAVASGGSRLTVAGVSEGTATVTVTARDSDDNQASDAFEVSVTAPPPPNQAPTVSAAIADATIVNESGTQTVSLSGVFSDADNDALTITAASSNRAVATVSVSSGGSSLTVTAKSRGTATITVTADDGKGGAAEDAFTVNVKAAPVVASAIADLNRLETGDTRDIDLSGVFSDADGDSLTFTADTSDPAVADAFIFQGTLTVIATADGSATITVTARDTDGNAVSDTFDVSVVGPPTPVSNLSCVATTGQALFQWNAPQWSGAELYAYDYDLTLPDGRSHQVRLRGYPLVREKGDYQAGAEASISVTAVYELADGTEVYSEAVSLTCAVAE